MKGKEAERAGERETSRALINPRTIEVTSSIRRERERGLERQTRKSIKKMWEI